MNGNNVWWKVVVALVLVAAVIGLAGLAFQAGVAQGVAQKIQLPAASGTAPMPYYGMPYVWPHMWFGGFGFFGVLIGIFVFFMILRMIAFMLFGPRWGHMRHHYGPWGMHHGDPEDWNKGVPPPIAEWHRRLHEEQPSQTDQK